MWTWSAFQSRGSVFTRRLSLGKYPDGYRRLWNWSHSMRRERGGVGIMATLTGSTTVDRRASREVELWMNQHKTKPRYSSIHWHTPVLYPHTNTVSSYPYCTPIPILYPHTNTVPHTPYCEKFLNINYKIELKVKLFLWSCQNNKISKNYHPQQFFAGMITYLFGQ